MNIGEILANVVGYLFVAGIVLFGIGSAWIAYTNRPDAGQKKRKESNADRWLPDAYMRGHKS